MNRQRIRDLKRQLRETQSSVEKGENLSDSMRENEEFPSILVDMIKAGEASGSLEEFSYTNGGTV